ncbi:hypothetical protein GLOIN_2v1690023 [Rhizophagus irregularis DAOM 181602=DAOM 197198]|uniref:Uncharacterized protein n=1 Tax=Rhizophagus irregularis (strain DAOM 181602 / DAOM 197198 / MUCL 43194) TaxID=747089 RepID=A0A2P4PCF4_RHIID|nr:hypothetical protein GLOIN_2v1690023 [Rhizophagus irregularis DAOM 181602=DAOM 197198]POG63062.1 hypothetical protein GLOIN_2v1690023 [Rhizophagus irregularis DAOM 181602=DAOM 197198]|eukprot:XP_025169928.1 hypothetical protein GLOIN_2v1690023 [Rhizophagus irregularis DAOM 181602=DAOM 197198]
MKNTLLLIVKKIIRFNLNFIKLLKFIDISKGLHMIFINLLVFMIMIIKKVLVSNNCLIM